MKTNRKAAGAVTETMQARLVAIHGGSLDMTVTLGYDSTDPYAVTAILETATLKVTWTFARELIGGGLQEPTGDGDVHVWPCLDNHGRVVVALELCSDTSDALIELPTAQVAAFIERSFEIVPAGTEAEHLDVDGLLETILADAA